MIRLTRINHKPLVLNADLIEHMEPTPDTLISLTNGQKFVVLESTEEVIQRVVDFRRSIGLDLFTGPAIRAERPQADPERPTEAEPARD